MSAHEVDTMATRTTDPEWEYAVIGTTLCVSVGAVLLGVFQLVDGESVGTVPLFFGGIGLGLLLYRWYIRMWRADDGTDSSATAYGDDPYAALLERYTRGNIDDTRSDDQSLDIRPPCSDDDDEQDESTAKRSIVPKRN